MNNFERASVLTEALPYIRVYSKKTIVVKYDSKAMLSEELKKAVISDIVLLSLVGVRVVVVHGYGPENDPIFTTNKKDKFVDGQHFIDEETMDLVQMISSKIGKELVSMITDEGATALSFSGLDGSLFSAKKLKADVDCGMVGEIISINPEIVNVALENSYIPVVSSIARGVDTKTNYHINANTAAMELAIKLGAVKLVLLTDTCGVQDEGGTLITELPLSKVRPLIKKGFLSTDMLHKVDCCVKAVRRGIPRAHILDGRKPHSILIEMLTNSGIGTMILHD